MLRTKTALAAMCLAVAAVALPLSAEKIFGRLIPARGAVGAGGVVNLPYNTADSQGNQWLFYNYGQFQHQGNMPVYSQGAMLQINGNYCQARNNQAKVDEKTGEVLFENMQVGQFSVTRRIMINKEEGYIRYIDIIKNTGNAEASPNLMMTTNLNYGVQIANTVPDPKKQSQQIGWVAQTHANGRCVMEMYAGKAAKSLPTIQYQQGNSAVQMSYNPPIGAGKEIAFMHFHGTTNSLDQATKFITNLKESKIMSSIPPAIRKLIINFRGGENFIGDYEILRGEILDVVELRSGDQLKGTLKEKSFKLDTFYGTVELTVDNVIGLINAGEFRPRQLVVTKDGEVFGGKLDREKLTLELSSGQVTEIPLSQVLRMGYRKRAGEPEEWTFDKPIVLMRTGDRIGVRMPATVIDVNTRYGQLKLKPETIAAVNFQSEEHGVHDVFLTDGSKFAGLVSADIFDMKLAGEGPAQGVKFPASSMRRLQLAKASDGPDDGQAVLNLANDDMLIGSLTGTLKLDTAFSTITLNAGEIKKLVKAPGSPSDVQVTLWDETTVSGQLQEQSLACQLVSGVAMNVPVALVEDYNQPRPKPSAAVIDTIKTLVADLGADDWKKRDLAQEKLTTMGVVVASTLREMRASQSAEAQQRIDLILKAVEKDGGAPLKSAPGAGAGAVADPAHAVPEAPLVLPQFQIQQLQGGLIIQD